MLIYFLFSLDIVVVYTSNTGYLVLNRKLASQVVTTNTLYRNKSSLAITYQHKGNEKRKSLAVGYKKKHKICAYMRKFMQSQICKAQFCEYFQFKYIWKCRKSYRHLICTYVAKLNENENKT